MSLIKKYYPLALKGMAMGAADVVPGVSGGTIAFISGIYEELLNSLKSFNAEAVRKILSGNFKSFWQHINGWFLLFIATGIGISIVSLSKVILFLLESYPTLIWSFFFGLVVASAVFVAGTISKWSWDVILSAIIGTGLAYYITVASPAQTPEQLWFVFITGAIAICAMILPGISGSFILLLMGKYTFILNALHTLRGEVIAIFVAGCFFGIVSFSHILSWMLKKYHNATVALLTGFMFGSLNKVWPWKEAIETTMIEGKEVVLKEQNISPMQYAKLQQQPNDMVWCILLALFGFILIYLIERMANKKHRLI